MGRYKLQSRRNLYTILLVALTMIGINLLTGMPSFVLNFYEDENLTARRVLAWKYKFMNGSHSFIHSKTSLTVDMKYLRHHVPFIAKPSYASELNKKEFVFVSASDKNYFNKLVRLITNIREVFPQYKIIVYDLGLEFWQWWSVKMYRRVELRSFNFQAYPPHVQRLKYYSFKPLIILEVLRSYPSVFWVDTSTVFYNPNNLTMMLPQSISEKPLSMFDRCGHTVYQATAPQTYDFLATDIDRMRRTDCLGANAILIYNNQQLFDSVIFPWALCALVKECMAPIDTLHCDFKQYSGWARCHRFDQSAINILIYNMMGYDESRVWNKDRLKILDVRR